MDYKAVLNLMKEMNRTDLTKLEIEEEGIRICLEKSVNTIAINQPTAGGIASVSPAGQIGMMPVQQPVMSEQSVNNSQMNQAGQLLDQKVANTGSSEEAACKKIVSPMVGTFYLSPSPDKPAFVKVGDRVKKGQTVCIIEAMKLMNEIESEQDGEIIKILVNNEEMVEFGQPMFLVKAL